MNTTGPTNGPSSLPWPQPIRDGYWTDGDGTVWRMRGRRKGGETQVSGARLRRLQGRGDVRVLHVYGPEPTVVDGPSRDALLGRIDDYFAGRARPHNSFRVAEFRDDHRRIMVVVEESC